MYCSIVENKLKMSSNLYFTANYDILCLFTNIRIKINFPCINVMEISLLIWFAVAFGYVTVGNNDVLSVENFGFEVIFDIN